MSCCLAVMIALAAAAPLHSAEVKRIEWGDFRVEYDSGGVRQIGHARDPFGAKVIADGQQPTIPCGRRCAWVPRRRGWS